MNTQPGRIPTAPQAELRPRGVRTATCLIDRHIVQLGHATEMPLVTGNPIRHDDHTGDRQLHRPRRRLRRRDRAEINRQLDGNSMHQRFLHAFPQPLALRVTHPQRLAYPAEIAAARNHAVVAGDQRPYPPHGDRAPTSRRQHTAHDHRSRLGVVPPQTLPSQLTPIEADLPDPLRQLRPDFA